MLAGAPERGFGGTVAADDASVVTDGEDGVGRRLHDRRAVLDGVGQRAAGRPLVGDVPRERRHRLRRDRHGDQATPAGRLARDPDLDLDLGPRAGLQHRRVEVERPRVVGVAVQLGQQAPDRIAEHRLEGVADPAVRLHDDPVVAAGDAPHDAEATAESVHRGAVVREGTRGHELRRLRRLGAVLARVHRGVGGADQLLRTGVAVSVVDDADARGDRRGAELRPRLVERDRGSARPVHSRCTSGGTSRNNTTNSSPPKRATTSRCRAIRTSRAPTSTSTASPVW